MKLGEVAAHLFAKADRDADLVGWIKAKEDRGFDRFLVDGEPAKIPALHPGERAKAVEFGEGEVDLAFFCNGAFPSGTVVKIKGHTTPVAGKSLGRIFLLAVGGFDPKDNLSILLDGAEASEIDLVGKAGDGVALALALEEQAKADPREGDEEGRREEEDHQGQKRGGEQEGTSDQGTRLEDLIDADFFESKAFLFVPCEVGVLKLAP